MSDFYEIKTERIFAQIIFEFTKYTLNPEFIYIYLFHKLYHYYCVSLSKVLLSIIVSEVRIVKSDVTTIVYQVCVEFPQKDCRRVHCMQPGRSLQVPAGCCSSLQVPARLHYSTLHPQTSLSLSSSQ